MKDVIAFNKNITLTEILNEVKDVENLDGQRFAKEHSGSVSGGFSGSINVSVVNLKSAKACWNVLLKDNSSNENCPFSHNRNVIMQTSLDMV